MTDTDPRERLTRADQVLDVLRAGGWIITSQPTDGHPHPTTTLHAADGTERPACLTALKIGVARCDLAARRSNAGEVVERWELR